ncbi:nucleotidyltransferase family protein [Mangrovicoccus sp. HB161399]|uniref:nucleotidyltransferase family protein n=1 Tax=Mangrovicoccus sp. HB161399 TaxID=2720392 RepID=UPI00155321BC|nr:nucleotidyltransferase family protein [Mangrovicoccus sp. HB161399]
MRNRPDSVMLFAAGFGTRMRPLTDTRPKPLIEVAGRSLLDHALAQCAIPQIVRRAVNAHYLGDQIEAAAAVRRLLLSRERDRILDTGGGLKAALPLLGDPEAVFAMNTDAVWTGPLAMATLAAAWDPERMDGLLLLCPPERAVGHALKSGFAMGEDGQLSWAPELAYTGAQVLATRAVADCAETVFSVKTAWDAAMAAGRLFGVMHPGHWCDVGHPGGIAEAEAMLADV